MKHLIHPAKGTLGFSWQKTLWFYIMVIPALCIDFAELSTHTIVIGITLTFLTVCFGHSIGLHRGVIHKAYVTSNLMRKILVYLFVLTGLGSPITWMKLHYYRDYWQNRQDCPPYFAYQHSIFRDFWWYLHLSFNAKNDAKYSIPASDLNDPWYLWLHKTWYFHNLILMGLIFVLSDLNTMLFLMNFRIAIIIIGHWYIGYAAHKYGYARFEIDKANESGYNDVLLGILSFGEGFHNNHHGHPTSAKFSAAWYEIDLSWYMILGLEKLGLIHKVKKPFQHQTLKITAKKHNKLRWRWPWQANRS